MATASLGRLTLDLVARIAGYTEPLSKAERETRRSTQAISQSFDVASLAVKGFGLVLGGLSVAGIVSYSEKVINAGNDIQKFAKLANASIGQFQYFAKGAETVGISLESFADKMKEMQERIGDFQQTGGGPLADFFKNIAPRVGVTIQQFQKLSGPEALQLFYNSLEKAGASTNDIKHYMEDVISDSSLLIPLLEKNGQGFKFWGDAAQKFGAILSDEMVKKLAEAKVNLQLLDLQWQGVQATLVNTVMPVFDAVVEYWDEIKAGAVALAAVVGTRLALAFGIAGAQAAASLITYARYQIRL